MEDNKHRAVWEWLLLCPYIGDLFFHFAQGDDGDVALVPSESVVQEFISGASLRAYDVALTRVAPCSFEPNDPMNLEQMAEFARLGDWIEEQNAAGNYPEFSIGESVQEIRLLPNQSGFAVAQDGRSCRYMLQFQIEYLKEAN